MREALETQLGLKVGEKKTTQLDVFSELNSRMKAAIASMRAALNARKSLQVFATQNNCSDVLELMLEKLDDSDKEFLERDVQDLGPLIKRLIEEGTLKVPTPANSNPSTPIGEKDVQEQTLEVDKTTRVSDSNRISSIASLFEKADSSSASQAKKTVKVSKQAKPQGKSPGKPQKKGKDKKVSVQDK